VVGQKRYVDVNVFVYWLGNHPEFGKKAHEWIKRIENSARGRYMTSSLTIYEVLVIIAGLTGRSLRDLDLINGIISGIKNLAGLEIVPLSLDYIEKAAELMKEHGLDYEDALHLAVALRKGAEEIISNDRDFDSTPLRRTF
jgi:predicted nucleic acid-binding protein